MLNIYKLRVSFTPNNNLSFDIINDILKNRCERYIAGYEIGKQNETPHIHAYIEMSVDRETIKNDIRKAILPHIMKRPEWSFTQVKDWLDDPDGIKPKCYALKDGDFTQKGFSEEEMLTLKQFEEKTKISIKEAKKERKTQLQQIEEDCKFSEFDFTFHEPKSHISTSVVIWYRDKGILIREFAIKSILQTLFLKYIPSYTEEFRLKLLSQLITF